MGGYTKNIAVVQGLKEGFSADGGKLSGLVKAEKYGSELKVEISLINFAPLTEGRYVAAITDGKATQLIENCLFEGASEVDTGGGFAVLICYAHGGISPVAYAVCGAFHGEALGLKDEIAAAEKISEKPVYEDEALAEVNYYEYEQTDSGGGAVCESAPQEKAGNELSEDEKIACAVEEEESGVKTPLAGGEFYKKMKREIEGLLSAYPPCEQLCAAVENSRWVKIDYKKNRYYVFGVISDGGEPAYICYGVPAEGETPPPEMAGLASFLPVKSERGNGFWVMYQDASTGAAVKIESA